VSAPMSSVERDHAAIEPVSVLTRPLPPRRVPAPLVTAFLDHHFPPATSHPPGVSSTEVLAVAEREAVGGGAIHDLVVALAAVRAGATLLGLGHRSGPTYAAAEVPFELLA